MGWEARGGGSYYYRKIRRGRRVVSVYGGSGELGRGNALVDELERAERAERAEQREQQRAELQDLDDRDRAEAERLALVETQARAMLEARGFRQHARGQWRQRRMTTTNPTTTDDDPKPLGFRTRLVESSAILRAFPHDGDKTRRGELREELARLRSELAGPSCSPVERLLIDQISLAWLEFHNWSFMAMAPNASFDSLATIERFRDRSHARYLRSLKLLAQIKSLDLASVEAAAAVRAEFAGVFERRQQQLANGTATTPDA